MTLLGLVVTSASLAHSILKVRSSVARKVEELAVDRWHGPGFIKRFSIWITAQCSQLGWSLGSGTVCHICGREDFGC